MPEALHFHIGNQSFALAVAHIRHVLKYPSHMTPVPHVSICGLMNMRGRIVTVLDTHRMLDISASHTPSRIVAFENGHDMYGLAVDHVSGIIAVPDIPDPLPASLSAQHHLLCSGIIQSNDALVTILRPDFLNHLMETS